MDGYQYEQRCAKYLEEKGFSDIKVTPGSGDQGVDIIASKDGKKYGIQCKYYTGSVGNKAVQEAYAGAAFYSCNIAMVITNSTFSSSAIELANSLGVILQDGVDAIVLSQNITPFDSLSREKKISRIERYLYNRECAVKSKFLGDAVHDEEVLVLIKSIRVKANQNLAHYRSKEDRIDRIASGNRTNPDFRRIDKLSNTADKLYKKGLCDLLDTAHREGKTLISYSISEQSAIALIALIRELWADASSPKTAKYARIMTFWENYEDTLPSSLRKREREREQAYLSSIQSDLKSASKRAETLKKQKADLEKAISCRTGTLQELEGTKSILEAQIGECESELSNLVASYNKTLIDLNNSITSVQDEIQRKMGALSSMLQQQSSLPLLAIKKKSTISGEINNISSLLESLKTKAESLQAEVEATNKEQTASINEAKRKLGQLRRKLKKTNQDIFDHNEAVEKKTTEKDLNRIGTELRKTEKKIRDLEEQIEDLHSYYLLDTYSELMSGR